MYSEQDYLKVNKQMKRHIIYLIVGFFIFLALSLFVSKKIGNKYGLMILIIGVSIEMFFLGMYATPIYAYNNYLKELILGRSREIAGSVISISKNPVYKDNKLYFNEIIILEEGIERVLLLDNQKKWSNIDVSSSYNFTIHENFIIDFKSIKN